MCMDHDSWFTSSIDGFLVSPNSALRLRVTFLHLCILVFIHGILVGKAKTRLNAPKLEEECPSRCFQFGLSEWISKYELYGYSWITNLPGPYELILLGWYCFLGLFSGSLVGLILWIFCKCGVRIDHQCFGFLSISKYSRDAFLQPAEFQGETGANFL